MLIIMHKNYREDKKRTETYVHYQLPNYEIDDDFKTSC